jgi:hypothetical protein
MVRPIVLWLGPSMTVSHPLPPRLPPSCLAWLKFHSAHCVFHASALSRDFCVADAALPPLNQSTVRHIRPPWTLATSIFKARPGCVLCLYKYKYKIQAYGGRHSVSGHVINSKVGKRSIK